MSSSSITDLSLDSLKAASKCMKVPRGLSRGDLPLSEADRVEDASLSESSFACFNKGLLIVVCPSVTGLSEVSKYQDLIDSVTSADGATPTPDVLAFTAGENDDRAIDVQYTDDTKTSILLQVSDSSVTAASICDLATAFYKGVVSPFESEGGRAKWKASSRPDATCDYTEDENFKLSFDKRLNTIFGSAKTKIDQTFDNVFANKVISTARGSAGRFARKQDLAMKWKTSETKPAAAPNPTESGAGAGVAEGA